MFTNLIPISSSSFHLRSREEGIKAKISASPNVVLPHLGKHARTINRALTFTKLTVTHGSILRVRPKSGTLVQAKASSSPNKSSSPWQKWVLGVMMTVILPVVGYKGSLLSNLKSKIDTAVKIVGNVAKVVEEVGEEAEKILEEVEEKLPDDSKLKETLESFDDLAKKAVSEARKAEDIVHKVKDVEEELEETIGKSRKGC